MGKKIKQHKPVLSLKHEVVCQNNKALSLFSFVYLTNNQEYNFSYFRNNFKEELDTRKSLDRLLEEISRTSLLDLSQRNKYQLGGFETISFGQIAFTPSNLNLTKDEKIFIFRFGSADSYRMLCWRRCGCYAIYIIGYDFNFSAYKH